LGLQFEKIFIDICPRIKFNFFRRYAVFKFQVGEDIPVLTDSGAKLDPCPLVRPDTDKADSPLAKYSMRPGANKI
jgi:hypothetical protein